MRLEFFTTDEQIAQIYYLTEGNKSTEFFSPLDDYCLCTSMPLCAISILQICVIRSSVVNLFFLYQLVTVCKCPAPAYPLPRQPLR